MLARCEYKKHPHYESYGGNNITVCKEWHDYKNFRDWALLHGYSDKLTIDRIDNNKGYTPNNCRWATMQEQQNNKSTNHIVYLNGVGHTISEWSRILGIGKTTIRMRLVNGWSVEDALTTPVRKRMNKLSSNHNTKMDLEDKQ